MKNLKEKYAIFLKLKRIQWW